MPDKFGIRLVATDIDGTLVNDRSELSPYTLNMLRQLLDRNLPIVLVTGLNPWPVKRYVRQIGRGIRAICLNGIFVLEDMDQKPGSFVDIEVAVKAVRIILERGYVPIVYGADNVSRYIAGAPESMVKVAELITDRPFQPYVPVADAGMLFDVRPAQISVCDTDSRAAKLYPDLQNAIGNCAYVVYQPAGRSGRSWVEVNHPQARKDIALLALAQRMGISANEILYFGDSLNDIPVFEVIDFPVAVGNARSEVLNLAWQTTLSNNEDGVACFLANIFKLEPASEEKP